MKTTGSTDLSKEAIESSFAEVRERCYNRSLAQMKQGEAVQYYSTLKGTFAGLILRYGVPLFGDYFSLKTFLAISVGATRIDGMALPERPHTVPFDDEKIKKTKSLGWVLWSLGVLSSGVVAAVSIGQGGAEWRERLVEFTSHTKLY